MRSGGGERNVKVGDPGKVRAIGVNLQPHGHGGLSPVVAYAGRVRLRAEDRLEFARELVQTRLSSLRKCGSKRECQPVCRSRAGARRPGRRHIAAQRRLQGTDKLVGQVLVRDFDDELRVIELLLLGSTENQNRGPPPPTNVVSAFQDIFPVDVPCQSVPPLRG